MTNIMVKRLLVILDSNELIFGLIGNEEYPKILMDNLKNLNVNNDFRINKQILGEILDNIPSYLKNRLFGLFSYDVIRFENIPINQRLLNKYKNLKLKKGDNIIAAYAEQVSADFLISENRHFLKELKTRRFKILNAERFLKEVMQI